MQCKGRMTYQHRQARFEDVLQNHAESDGRADADDRDLRLCSVGTKKPALAGCIAICARRNCAAGVRSRCFTVTKRRQSNRQNDGCKGLVSGVQAGVSCRSYDLHNFALYFVACLLFCAVRLHDASAGGCSFGIH